MTAPAWPKHPDGTPKRMGEMTPDEQRAQARHALRKLKRELESPAMARAVLAEPCNVCKGNGHLLQFDPPTSRRNIGRMRTLKCHACNGSGLTP